MSPHFFAFFHAIRTFSTFKEKEAMSQQQQVSNVCIVRAERKPSLRVYTVGLSDDDFYIFYRGLRNKT
ncbi:hypothetical protein HanXRQr2_Chr02g0070391 [Helianthus annuus]|uniref:Uncharacterized protein n=1 Tax=Helianthus annuus TaxID=4232 RepID=A0A9K3JPG0_HELAN|nr:hypothetical protein HanXRQr2_Chr02g0070391 [Helianthus annuus]